jgi:hypothetical protein
MKVYNSDPENVIYCLALLPEEWGKYGENIMNTIREQGS